MGTVRSFLLWSNLTVWLLVACGTPAEKSAEAKPPVTEAHDTLTRDTFRIPVRATSLYIKALQGLRLRKGPSPASEQLTTIPFGEKVQKLDSLPGDTLTIEGHPGRMVAVTYKDHRGYVFDGFTTTGSVLQPRRLENGKYCFTSYNSPGEEYLEFTVGAGQTIRGSGDGHTEGEEESWQVSFTGIFDENGNILIRSIVENAGGVRPPRLETWEVTGDDFLLVKRAGNRVFKFRKINCSK